MQPMARPYKCSHQQMRHQVNRINYHRLDGTMASRHHLAQVRTPTKLLWTNVMNHLHLHKDSDHHWPLVDTTQVVFTCQHTVHLPQCIRRPCSIRSHTVDLAVFHMHKAMDHRPISAHLARLLLMHVPQLAHTVIWRIKHNSLNSSSSSHHNSNNNHTSLPDIFHTSEMTNHWKLEIRNHNKQSIWMQSSTKHLLTFFSLASFLSMAIQTHTHSCSTFNLYHIHWKIR